MISRGVLFLLPYLLSLALSLGIAGYVRKHRGNQTARYFTYKVLAESLLIAAFILETVSRSLPEKILWDNAQYILDLALPGLGYLFVLSVAQRDFRARVGFLLVLLPSVLGAALLGTDSFHRLIRPLAYLNLSPIFPELLYPFTSVQYALFGYILAFGALNLATMARLTLRAKGTLRRQAFLVTIALLIPLAGSILSAFGIRMGPYRDTTPITLALQDLVIFVALAKFALFDLVPIARDLAIEQMGVSLFVEDLRHRIVDVNRNGSEIIGLPPRQIIGSDTKEVFSHHLDLLESHRHTSDAVFVVQGRRPNNVGRSFEIRISPARDRRGRRIGRLLLIQDITAQQRLEEELRNTRDELASRLAELQRAQEELLSRERLSALGQTVATVSHELRNPLATVRNALFSIRQAMSGPDRPRAQRALDLAERNIRRCDAIILELLDYSRPRAPALEQVQIDSWLSRLLDELETPTGIEVRRRLDSRAQARMDPEHLRQAVVNIHLNAVQAMTVEGKAAGILSVESRVRDGRIELTFQDNGAGMSTETRARAGEPLYSTKPFGVGLGLCIVKQVLQEHGGSLQIQSSEGNGTVMTLRLPALQGGGEA